MLCRMYITMRIAEVYFRFEHGDRGECRNANVVGLELIDRLKVGAYPFYFNERRAPIFFFVH